MVSSSPKKSSKKLDQQNPEEIRRMFDHISGRYDLLNRLMTFGLDQSWRKKMVSLLNLEGENQRVLDLATGTGDVAFTLIQQEQKRNRKIQIHALDFSSEMLEIAQQKSIELGLSACIDFQCQDIENLPFAENFFDGVTIAFGIRNVANRKKALQEILRVLKPNKTLVILEGIPARNGLKRFFQKMHLNLGVRFLGKILSDKKAYQYLGNSVTSFPEAGEFLHLMQTYGFRSCHHHPLFFGAASILTGKKPF